MRSVALAACAALVSGCFGYNSGAKKWAYVGDTILVLGGAGAVTMDIVSKDEPCTGSGCSSFDPPFGGAMVAGAVLITAGVVGMIVNATRPTVKTSR
jgi:hypothetical protein